MEVYRLARKQFATPLNGLGASRNGARWNSVGTELIYVAANRSLAMAEVAVHFSAATAPLDYVMLTIFIPDSIDIRSIRTEDLLADWHVFPHPSATRQIGDRFAFENQYCVLRVPSSVTKGDYSYLINPRHADFSKINVVDQVPFRFDNRLFS